MKRHGDMQALYGILFSTRKGVALLLVLALCVVLLPPTGNAAASDSVPQAEPWTFTAPVGGLGLTQVVTATVTAAQPLPDGAAEDPSSTLAASILAKPDHQPPVTTHEYSPPLPANGWFSTTVTITLTATDDNTGVAETRWRRQADVDWTVGTVFTLTEYSDILYQSVDNAGNEETPVPLLVQIDSLPPESSVTLTPVMPASGWYSVPVTISIAAVDDLSGWEGLSYYRLGASGDFLAGTQAVVNQSGIYPLQYYSRDVAGNTEPIKSYPESVRVDLEPPTVQAVPAVPDPWARPPITVTLQAEDTGGSGLGAVEYRKQGVIAWTQGITFTVAGADGRYTYEYRARDLAGNASSVLTVAVGIDATPPGSVQDLQALPDAWTNQADKFGLEWINPQDLSGIAGIYYQIDEDPLWGGTPTYVEGVDIESLSDIVVDSEGEHTVYVWLQDGAGNSDEHTRQALLSAFRYDATMPYCDEPGIVGPLGEDGKHYTGPITLTITAHDGLSGVAVLYYRIEDSPIVTVPITGTPFLAQYSFTLAYTDTRKLIQYWAEDAAGNVEPSPCGRDVYFDTRAPESPIDPTTMPDGWLTSNPFSVKWTNPFDYSKIAGVYYRLGQAPTSNTDGPYKALPDTFTPTIALTVTTEGVTPLYLWLKDKAGNVDYHTAISIPVRYDITPPTTTISAVGTLRNGFYISPLTLRFTAQDTHSGVDTIRYQINSAAEQIWDGQDLVLDQEGTYNLTYRSWDAAGNRETAKQVQYKIDLRAPVVSLSIDGGKDYVRVPSVRVNWWGSDGLAGSGIIKYTVEYRRSKCGPWQAWYTGADTSRTFDQMIANNTYYFRVKAEDRAGYVSTYSATTDNSYVYYEGLANGFFDSANWGAWVVDPGGQLGASVVQAKSHKGVDSWMARLSQEWPLREVPKDAYAAFYQQIQLPASDCHDGLILALWYRIHSYDLKWSNSHNDWQDTFEVYIKDRNGNILPPDPEHPYVFIDGNENPLTDPPTLWDLGWRRVVVDLSRWAGQQIRIEFRVENRWDSLFPTWVLVDDVQLLLTSGRVVRLPLNIVPPGENERSPSLAQPAESAPATTDSIETIDDTDALPTRR